MRIDTKTRKECKSAAKRSVRSHYFVFVLMCLFAAFIGAEFILSDNFISSRSDVMDIVTRDYEDTIIETEHKAASMTGASVLSDKIRGATELVEFEDEETNAVFSRSAGTINHIINAFTNGTIVDTISSVVLNRVGSKGVADTVMIGVSSVIAVAFWMFVQLVYTSVIRRVALEARIYKKVSINRFLFFMRTKSWLNAALTLTVYSVVSYLALATIVAFPVVFYGLCMVPYILAVNPQIHPF